MNNEKNETDLKYTVAVVATMSAGKSTLLNSILEEDLLPAQNEACTATVFRIEDYDNLKSFEGAYIDGREKSNWEPVNQQLLSEWNSKSFREIEIRGNMPYLNNTPDGYRVVFFDTPGPNNSRTRDHEKITKKIIRRADFCSLICVLNCSVTGVQDEWRLLTYIQKEMKNSDNKLRPIFILNKIDVLDIDGGESVCDLVKTTTAYMKELCFVKPTVLPACSYLSLLIRKCLKSAQRMTAKEVMGDYRGAEKLKSFFSRRYKSTFPDRKQKKLCEMLHSFLDLQEEYKKAFFINSDAQKAFEASLTDHRPTPRRKIKIGGEYFKYADLYLVDLLSGIPVLENILNNQLVSFAKNNNRRNKNA